MISAVGRRCGRPVSAARVAAICGAVMALAAATASARDKVDVVTMTNGDRVTGEIVRLEAGLLELKTDHMGTLSVEWVWVDSVDSEQLFEVEESGGEQFFGTLRSGDEAGELEVLGLAGRSYVLAHGDVVRIAQQERRMLDRWSGYVDLGLSTASANDEQDFTLDAEANYRSERSRLYNSLAASQNDREDAEKTSRTDMSTVYRRTLARRWFWYSGVGVARNEELDLELRATLGGGGGRYVWQTNRAQWSLFSGVSGVREDYFGDDGGEWSVELVLASDYQLYLFTGRETMLQVDLAVLPSLTVSGRYRVEFSSSFRRKLVRDFTIAFSLDESYDSEPPEGSESSDTRFRTTLGWTF